MPLSARPRSRSGGNSNVTRVRDFPAEMSTLPSYRAGVIPFCLCKDGKIRYCLGVDTKTEDITDLSGGYHSMRHRNVIDTALRELKEESLGAFCLVMSVAKECIAVYDVKRMSIFYRVTEEEMEESLELFRSRLSYNENPEVKELVLFTFEEMEGMFNKVGDRVLYEKTRTLLMGKFDIVHETLTRHVVDD